MSNNLQYAIFAVGRLLRGSLFADKAYLRILYKYKMKKKLDLANPQSYNEKLQWMKLFDRNPKYTDMVDKYAVKKYVSQVAGDEFVIPTLGVWNYFDEIDFSKLPHTFVIKCTHDSGGLVVVKNKNDLDKAAAKKKIEHCLKRNYFTNLREWPYKNVPPRIIAEEYIGNIDALPVDYKFYCFAGEIDSVMLCLDRDKGKAKYVFFDTDWNRLYYLKDEPQFDTPVKKPDNFDQMVSLVKRLCTGFAAVRVDLYNVEGKIYFGELTFFNQSGFDVDITEETDLYWGSKLKLENQAGESNG